MDEFVEQLKTAGARANEQQLWVALDDVIDMAAEVRDMGMLDLIGGHLGVVEPNEVRQ